MKIFSLQEYADSSTSAPEFIGNIVTDKKQIHKIAYHNGLTETMVANEYATVPSIGADHKTAICLAYIRDFLVECGNCEGYLTESGDVYATKAGQNYDYLENDTEDPMWAELQSYGEPNE